MRAAFQKIPTNLGKEKEERSEEKNGKGTKKSKRDKEPVSKGDEEQEGAHPFLLRSRSGGIRSWM